MKSNELRLGNWIKYTNHKELRNDYKGTFLKVDIDTLMYIDTNNHADFYEPIELTPEILEKCGFENDNGEFSIPNLDFDLMICCSENGLWCAYNFGHVNPGPLPHRIPTGMQANPICNPFKHLHQLQNLVHALTGEELTVNL